MLRDSEGDKVEALFEGHYCMEGWLDACAEMTCMHRDSTISVIGLKKPFHDFP